MIGPMQRLKWLILPTMVLFITLVAALLTADPSGHGTHRTLGLPPCLFLFLTGVLCPGCGLTTSFTHFVHGNLSQAFTAHPLGPLLYLTLLLLGGLSLAEFFGRTTPLRGLMRGKYIGWIYAAGLIFMIIWPTRLVWTHI